VNDQQRDYYYRRYYGITLEQYDALLQQSQGKCYCCGKSENGTKRLSVDHDHSTGEIRGLLCFLCNHYLIGRHRDPLPFDNAGRYLRGPYTGYVVPKEYLKGRKKKRTRKKKK
jgi:hypothetical protein